MRMAVDFKVRAYVNGLCRPLRSHITTVVSAHCELGAVSSGGVDLERERTCQRVVSLMLDVRC
jgi:hypothetical protein